MKRPIGAGPGAVGQEINPKSKIKGGGRGRPPYANPKGESRFYP
jgi:hypothetical protein